MEGPFGKSFFGDPGVPHTGPERFVGMWAGISALSAVTWFTPRIWQLPNKLANWHDKALVKEHNHWKKMLEHNSWKKMFEHNQWSKAMEKQQLSDKATEKQQPFQLKWNKKDK